MAEVIFTSSFAFGVCAFAAGAEINQVITIAVAMIVLDEVRQFAQEVIAAVR